MRHIVRIPGQIGRSGAKRHRGHQVEAWSGTTGWRFESSSALRANAPHGGSSTAQQEPRPLRARSRKLLGQHWDLVGGDRLMKAAVPSRDREVPAREKQCGGEVQRVEAA